MSHAFHPVCNGFFIYDTARPKGYSDPEPFPDPPGQNLQLYLSHQLQLQFPAFLIPLNLQLRLFLFDLTQPGQRLHRIAALLQYHLIGKHRLQQRQPDPLFTAQPLSGKGMLRSRYRRHTACFHFLQQLISCAGIQPDLIHLFLHRPALGLCQNLILYCQLPSCHLQIGKPASLFISADFIDSGPKCLGTDRRRKTGADSPQKIGHSFSVKGRTEITGKQQPLADQFPDFLIRYPPGLQKHIQRGLLAHGNALIKRFRSPAAFRKIHTSFSQLF